VIPVGDENPTLRPAIVTIALIAVNLGVYFGIQFSKQPADEAAFDYEYAAVPCELSTGEPVVAVPLGTAGTECTVDANTPVPLQPFPDKNVHLAVVSSMFLHASVLHVLGNMLFLWIFGNNVEDQLGHFWYLVLYLGGGVVASATHVVGNLDSATPFLGASGAVAAVMGAYIVWFPRAKVMALIPPLIFFVLKLPAFVVLGFWFVLQFLLPDNGVATLAHIGGFVFGMLVAFVLARAAQYPRPRFALP
jgi:membrane associated rhomboid family serine protease